MSFNMRGGARIENTVSEKASKATKVGPEIFSQRYVGKGNSAFKEHGAIERKRPARNCPPAPETYRAAIEQERTGICVRYGACIFRSRRIITRKILRASESIRQ